MASRPQAIRAGSSAGSFQTASVITRSAEPLLAPEPPDEREGVVPNVVFPTAIDRRGEGAADVYYGMAEARIGAFRLTMGRLPQRAGRR